MVFFVSLKKYFHKYLYSLIVNIKEEYMRKRHTVFKSTARQLELAQLYMSGKINAELARYFKVAPSTITQRLKMLKREGLIK